MSTAVLSKKTFRATAILTALILASVAVNAIIILADHIAGCSGTQPKKAGRIRTPAFATSGCQRPKAAL